MDFLPSRNCLLEVQSLILKARQWTIFGYNHNQAFRNILDCISYLEWKLEEQQSFNTSPSRYSSSWTFSSSYLSLLFLHMPMEFFRWRGKLSCTPWISCHPFYFVLIILMQSGSWKFCNQILQNFIFTVDEFHQHLGMTHLVQSLWEIHFYRDHSFFWDHLLSQK